jgi:arginine-tRNA-protein transferase
VSFEGRQFPQFYLTPDSPCPYLPGRRERKVFTHLVGDQAPALNDMLTHGGFRRSQNIAYRPACSNCTSCVSVRVIVDAFRPNRTFKRTVAANRELVVSETEASASKEQYTLFRDYLDARHGEGGMADMGIMDFTSMIEDSFVQTSTVEYRTRPLVPLAPPDHQVGRLLGVVLTDRLHDGLSMVYSFYDPREVRRGLGTYMILDHIERARKLGLPYLYLGYWVAGSPKMDYKQRFRPQEHLTPQGWVRNEDQPVHPA